MTKRTIVLYLLPCPDCKGPASLFAQRFTRYGTQYAISCVDWHCGVNTTFMPNKTPEEMADRWNHGIGLVSAGAPAKQMPGQMAALEVTVDA